MILNHKNWIIKLNQKKWERLLVSDKPQQPTEPDRYPMSVFEMDSAGDLDDSALSRKIAKDLENCLFEDNESIANIDSGSIYFDQYIQKQNE